MLLSGPIFFWRSKQIKPDPKLEKKIPLFLRYCDERIPNEFWSCNFSEGPYADNQIFKDVSRSHSPNGVGGPYWGYRIRPSDSPIQRVHLHPYIMFAKHGDSLFPVFYLINVVFENVFQRDWEEQMELWTEGGQR